MRHLIRLSISKFRKLFLWKIWWNISRYSILNFALIWSNFNLLFQFQFFVPILIFWCNFHFLFQFQLFVPIEIFCSNFNFLVQFEFFGLIWIFWSNFNCLFQFHFFVPIIGIQFQLFVPIAISYFSCQNSNPAL